MTTRPRTREFVKMLDARYSSLAAELEEDIADYRGLTPDQNDAVVSGLARSAIEILRGQPDLAVVMATQEPPAADYQELVRRLMDRRSR